MASICHLSFPHLNTRQSGDIPIYSHLRTSRDAILFIHFEFEASVAYAVSTMNKLSEHDKVILDTIFDPLQPLGVDSNPGRIFNESIEAEDDPELSEEVKELLKRAIVLSENGKFDEAFGLFETARVKAPRSASVLNDRAQALRLAGRSEEALVDLNLAVEYSGGRGKAGVQALCQRAALYRFLEKDDEAREDFAKAAEQGSSFAKSQLVAMNPYAAMCNAMLHKITMDACQK